MWEIPSCVGEFVQLHGFLAGGHRQEKSPCLFVAQKQILGVDGGTGRRVHIRLLAGEHGGMLVPLEYKMIGFQKIEEFLFRCEHYFSNV